MPVYGCGETPDNPKSSTRAKASSLSMRPISNLTNIQKTQEPIVVRALGLLPDIGVGLPLGRDVMRMPVDIDSTHSLAIVKKIGERLRAAFKEDRELPVSFRKQIERLRQSESEALAKVAGPSRRDAKS
ncbi:hypothetical protein [Bradyrhizobium valentinum]|uniref:hypothetical protein n=1 Tax=Bradyrhizobium valentinum TaxID=1518501 RepID=UPI00070D2983|nr:hypothetical protein [Bradyrhizobium valentinum]KRR09705.1 hypothetical protein CQ10_41170 [Bradyrhizobium valentinum]